MVLLGGEDMPLGLRTTRGLSSHSVARRYTAESYPGALDRVPQEGNGETVSVIVPCFNKAAYVRRTLESIDAQTLEPLEVVVINDCSTDSSALAIDEWSRSTAIPCTILTHGVNLGLNASLNDGIRASKGEFLIFLDADDRLLPEMITNSLRRFRQSPRTGMVYGDALVVDPDGRPDHDTFLTETRGADRPEGMIFRNLFKRHNFMPVSSVTVRRSVLARVGLFDERLAYQDYDMWLRVSWRFPVAFSGSVDAEIVQVPGSMKQTIGSDIAASNLMILEKWRHDGVSDSLMPREKAAMWVLYLAGNRGLSLRSGISAVVRSPYYYHDPLLPVAAARLLLRVAISRAVRGS